MFAYDRVFHFYQCSASDKYVFSPNCNSQDVRLNLLDTSFFRFPSRFSLFEIVTIERKYERERVKREEVNGNEKRLYDLGEKFIFSQKIQKLNAWRESRRKDYNIKNIQNIKTMSRKVYLFSLGR